MLRKYLKSQGKEVTRKKIIIIIELLKENHGKSNSNTMNEIITAKLRTLRVIR